MSTIHYAKPLKRRTVPNSSNTSSETLIIEVVTPLLLILISLLLLFALKALYLKQQRIRDIHHAITSNQQEPQQIWDRSSSLSPNSTNSKLRPSEGANTKHDDYRAHRSGFFVGLLGDPAWEANMQRQIADHRWRQHSGQHIHRHTWHPYPSTPMTSYTFSPGRSSQASPTIPRQRFDRFECPSIEEIQQANIRRHKSLSITMTRQITSRNRMSVAKNRRTLEDTSFVWDDQSGTLSENPVHDARPRKIRKERISHTPEITISAVDEQRTSTLLPSYPFLLDSELEVPSAHAQARRSGTISPCPSQSSFLSLASTTHSKGSICEYDLDSCLGEKKYNFPKYPDEAHRSV